MILKIKTLMEAASPITHMSGTEGNEAVLATESVATEYGTAMVPYLSGNALRHRAIRRTGMLWLIDRFDLRGKLSAMQLNFLLHGGNLTGSTAHENMRRSADMHRLWPLIKLLGCAFPDQIAPGRLDVWRGSLVCRENAAMLPEIDGGELRSYVDLTSGYQYTRGDAKGSGVEAKESILESPSNLMIFSGQCVMRGAMFVGGFTLRSSQSIDIGALIWSLRLWQQEGCVIGGQGAKGHGRLNLSLVDCVVDQDAACDSYVAHVDSVRDEAVAWLQAVVG